MSNKDENKSKEGESNLGAQPFDRLFKENALKVGIALFEMRTGEKITEIVVLNHEFAKTSSRLVDFLFNIKTERGEEQLLHLEFQTANDKNMIFRMNEYHALLISEFKLPIKHLLIFLGPEKITMNNNLSEDMVFSSYETIDLKTLDPGLFLSSQLPEVFMLSLLGAYEKEQIDKILRKILKRIASIEQPPSEKKRYLNQLLILSRLRTLEVETQELINTMPIVYTRPKEEDGLYQMGQKEGIEVGLALAAKVFQRLRKSSPKQVALDLDLDLEFVLKVKEEFGL